MDYQTDLWGITKTQVELIIWGGLFVAVVLGILKFKRLEWEERAKAAQKEAEQKAASASLKETIKQAVSEALAAREAEKRNDS